MEVTKEKGVLIFKHPERGIAKFSLIDNSSIRINSGKEYQVKSLAPFFTGYSIREAFNGIEDEKFIDFIKLVSNSEKGCHSVNSFLQRMSKHKHMESVIKVGLKVEYTGKGGFYNNFKTDISDIPSDIIRICKDLGNNYDLKLSNRNFSRHCEDKRFFNIIRYSYELDPYFCYSLLKYYKSWNIDTIKKLLETLDSFNFEYKALLKYLQYISTYENIGISEALGYLDDYSKQSLLMVKNKKKIEKYPKYIKSKHDIVSKQYNIFKTSYNDEIFADMYIGRNFEYSDNKYSVIIPSKTEDIKEEGMELNHCIKSYIDGVLEGKYHIVFMRLSKELDQSFISMQIKDNVIYQCKGSMNRGMTVEELKFINKYAKIKKFKVSENL